MKASLINDSVWIFCPGCKNHHALRVKGNYSWTFNWDYEKPTFSPSLLCNSNHPNVRCHSFIKDGNIQFLSDCYHSLAGQTVELPDLEWKFLVENHNQP